MGRIKKAAGPKHEATVSPAVATFVNTAVVLPISKLPSHISSFPRRWPFPKGDVYHWIPLLNRFDAILEHFNAEYGLQTGPQTRKFTRALLEKGVAEENKAATITGASQKELDDLGYPEDGDRVLIESILVFSRLLLENCGNRSLYNSSDRLGDLLNTTDLSLLNNALRLAVRLAQRYHASRQRGANASQHLNNALLASHYNLDLERVQKLANPFTRLPKPSPTSSVVSATASNTKGKEKDSPHPPKAMSANDLNAIAKDDAPWTNGTSGSEKSSKTPEPSNSRWKEWGSVILTFYQPPTAPKGDTQLSTPVTPTPAQTTPTQPRTSFQPRRSSGLSRQSRVSSFDESSDTLTAPSAAKSDDVTAVGGMRTIEIPFSTIAGTPIEETLAEKANGLPKEVQFELLTKLRIAHAMIDSSTTRQRLVGIRLLAITNLAYIYPDPILQQKILQPDSDEPRRLQLAYQLADLIHSPGKGPDCVPIGLQTLAMGCLEALAKHKAKASDIAAALNINVTHGVLLYVLRRAVADVANEDSGNDEDEGDEWREALFSLLETLPTSAQRTGETLIAAGLLEIIVEILSHRTGKAQRSHPKILSFLDSIIYTIRDAFQTFANLKGLDVISDLIASEVRSGLENANGGAGLAVGFRNQSIDYQIPYHQQQTIRWLFKFINHMMSHGSGNFDRLLRNLIDSPQLLGGLRTVILNAKVFGSSVWSGAVNIMSNFIHNEPTSYAVIAEAGLSKGLLTAITLQPFPEAKRSATEAPATNTQSTTDQQANQEGDETEFWNRDINNLLKSTNLDEMLTESPQRRLADNILPATDAIVAIPQAFGAICLNNAGMDLFIRSKALFTFFKIFESPDHVKALAREGDFSRVLGGSFDELVRHHPRLKELVMRSVMSMVKRVSQVCSQAYGEEHGAKLLADSKALDRQSSGEDVTMVEANGSLVKAAPTLEDNTEDISNTKPNVATFIDVAMRFLTGFFENTSLCAAFVERGGANHILDLATSDALKWDFNLQSASNEIAKVVHGLAEQKPHLVLPTLLKRTQVHIDALQPMTSHEDAGAYFTKYISPEQAVKEADAQSDTRLVKSLVALHTLCNILFETFSGPIHNTRSSHTPFSQVNLADIYVDLVKGLARVHRCCVWEEILLQKTIPGEWNDASRVKGFGMGSDEADQVLGFLEPIDANTTNGSAPASGAAGTSENSRRASSSASSKKSRKDVKAQIEKIPQFKNLMALRFLLSQVPSSITPFFQSLGKALVAKRRPDAYARQNAHLVADAMAESTLDQLNYGLPIRPLDRPYAQCLTLLLQAFYAQGGFKSILNILNAFQREVKDFNQDFPHYEGSVKANMDGAARLASAYGGIKTILDFYGQVVNTKAIVESSQSGAIASTNDRDRGHPHFFSPSQFLVELRMAVLPPARSLWDSSFVEKASNMIVKRLIEILRTILEDGEEQHALRDGVKIPQRQSIPTKKYSIPNDKVNNMIEKGYSKELAQESLYRCLNVVSTAEEYCRLQKEFGVEANPIPAYEREIQQSPSPGATSRRASQVAAPESSASTRPESNANETGLPSAETLRSLLGTRTEGAEAVEGGTEETASQLSSVLSSALNAASEPNEGAEDPFAFSIGNLLNPADNAPRDSSRSHQSSVSPSPLPNTIEAEKLPDVVTWDKLDNERQSLRGNIIERALDVLNIHDSVTFELADLINTASSKTSGASGMRKDIGETLVQSLISFQADEDFRPAGKKIAAYANLLALVIQDRDFYDSTLEQLQSQFSALMGFIRIFPEQSPDETSPWIGQILLVLEKLLAEDVQPSQIQWTPPPNEDGERPSTPVSHLEKPPLPWEEKSRLFEFIVEILPRIGKDESLALSVVRVLVILTRDRDIASRLGEKSNIQRLFVMIKQLAGITNDRLQSSFMLLLRHIVEDDQIIRQIMRSEILANFESRPSRSIDTSGYVRQMYHLVLRAPEIFVEVTNDLLEIKNYDPNQRPQSLVMKPEVKDTDASQELSSVPESSNQAQVDHSSAEAPKPSTEEAASGPPQKAKSNELKTPILDRQSGVVHYILCELLAYKEVVDKDQTSNAKPPQESPELSDVEMEDSVAPTQAPPPSLSTTEIGKPRKNEKPDFKPEQHPIYIYRCFLLQCLTELLRSYNRTKIEFVNYSRKSDGKASTPSKPRSSILNYLLNDVIPVGTLNHEESIPFRKKLNTSNWAMSTIISLCLKTNERGHEKKRGSLQEDQDTDLQFVRKFVLEHASRSYREANGSEENLDVKYSRLLCLADLFNRLLAGKIIQSTPSQPIELNTNQPGSQKVLAKLMYEKNFISALTASIADIDLNFPGSKRAVKYILRPLKQLTQTAIVVSETSDDSTSFGHTDEDEISSATSVSEVGDEREETPDLFRNSTLGMFEPGREEESSSESSDDDEDMYDDEYEEGVQFEDEMERDGDDVVSDEDEDIEGVGRMEGLPGDGGMNVEVVIDGEDDEMSEGDDGDASEDGDEDEDDDEDDMEDDGEDIQAMEEITGDDENDSLADGDGEEWQDEREENEREAEDDGPIDIGLDQDTQSAVRNIAREFADGPAALRDLAMEMEGEGGRDDEEDDEEEGEEVEEEDVIYQPDLDFDDDQEADGDGVPDPPWGWDPDDDRPVAMPPMHHHHHHHPRRSGTPWHILPNFGGGPGDRLPSIYRPYRPNTGSRPVDDGTNPLLQRGDSSSSGSRAGPPGISDAAASISDYWVHGMEPPQRGIGMEGPVSFISNIIAAVGQGGTGFATLGGPGQHGAFHFHVGGSRGSSLPREVQALLGLRHSQEPPRTSREDPMQSNQFLPAVTPTRWQEEARLLYGNAHNEKVQQIVNSLLRLLVPPALEKEKKRKEAQKKAIEDAERLAKEQAEQERKAREAEKEAQELREQQEREAAAAAEAEAASRGAENTEEQAEESHEEAMEGVETTGPEGATESAPNNEAQNIATASAASGPSEPAERVRTTIRGRELDITGMGIDLEYLNALPEELREEVLMSQLAVQRSEAAAAGQEPTNISREFLEALPPDIREELLREEAQDRRRREREEARRRAAAEGGGPRAEEMDPASFLASLDPHLRQAVLMEQDDDVLAQLPTAIAAEARALGGDGRMIHRFGERLNRVRGAEREERSAQPIAQKAQRRPIRQMLDRSGVPTLLRLMFVQQQGSSRQTLNGILHDISQNKQNRAEVVSLLLSILQDGTTDVNAVERSFTSLSLRAKQPAAPKTPQTLKRTLTNQVSPINNPEMTPLMVVQQCLAALVSLTQYNASIPFFFLTEHEASSSIKGKSAKKGKAKDTKASRFALNALLSLLDRKLIMESSGCMEQLSSLLQSVTHPLTMLLRKEKDKPEEPQKTAATESIPTAPDSITQIENVTHMTQDVRPEGEATAEPVPMPDAQPENAVSEAAQEIPPTTVGPAETQSKPSNADASIEEKAKKPKSLTPPVVPEENLRLVVNILAARECSGKTFRDTLSTINNLSAIPEAKDVFGKALIEQAKALGRSILEDLDDLILQIKKAETGTDVQGMALAKFSPASSDQAKLLRVLTALDYLFDPKRNNGRTESVADDQGTGELSASKDDLLTTLYEHPTFGSLWGKLSECLGTIRQGEGTLSVATILLPLIEALMVVCKNTTIKDAPLVRATKDFAVASPPPESRIENLFFRFTEDHRKILNDLVRQNPKLMSGTFSLLVKNPKVLEFDNKRNYFTRRLHSRSAEQRHPQPPLQLSVRRDQVLLDSFRSLSFKSGDEIKYGKLSIRFHGEEGVDAGGVTREWFQVLSRQMFNPDYALFIPVASDRTTFHPNKLSHINDQHLMFFKFIGRMIGKALYEGRALDCHFSRAVYKRILGKSVSIKDMETLDLDYYKSLLWMLENDITEIITETFSIETDDFGVKEVVDLIPNGRNIPVTEDNKNEYVQRVVEYRLTGSVQTQLEEFLRGFHDIVAPELIAIFNEQELELLISGLPDIDVDDWKNHTEYHNYSASSSQIQWFWRAVRSFDKEERAKLLQFVTGTSKVPLNGFGQLEGMNGFSRFNIHRDYGNKDRLPSSHTCFNQLDLPEYESYESLRQQLYTAMTAGSEYFGFA